MAYNEFPRKGYGRIFVEKESDILVVKEIIRKMDEFEYDYLPEGLIAVFNPNIKRFPADNPKDHLWLDMEYTGVSDITRGVNEFDGCVFIDK